MHNRLIPLAKVADVLLDSKVVALSAPRTYLRVWLDKFHSRPDLGWAGKEVPGGKSRDVIPFNQPCQAIRTTSQYEHYLRLRYLLLRTVSNIQASLKRSLFDVEYGNNVERMALTSVRSIFRPYLMHAD